jgi:YHS domain-containing protein
MSSKMKSTILIVMILMGCVINGKAQDNRSAAFNLDDGVAIQGYDPVAYFTEHKAVEGSKKYSAKAEGVTYYFSSDEHKQTFLKDFKRYEPQYGGWCAYAMGETGEKVEVDPETFKVVDGKLYLFYNKFFNNTLPKWNANEKSLKEKADKNWTQLTKK